MKNKDFHFSNEVTEFTTDLGHLCPDKYSHIIEKDDTVELRAKVFEILIEQGKVVKLLKPNKAMEKILEKIQGFEGIEEEDEIVLDKCCDYWGQTYGDKNLYSDARYCLVKFEQEFTMSKKISDAMNIQDLIDNPSLKEIDFSANGKRYKLRKQKHNKFVLIGTLKCLIDGDSVESTKHMDNFKQMHANNKEVENVAWSDSIMPKKTLKKLNELLDEICKNEREDYHPGSEKVVRDIVHPSLYPYIKNVSVVEESPLSNYKKPKKKEEFNLDVDFWGRAYEDSIYQWLPAEFFVSEQGKVSLNSYINNLNRDKYPQAYNLIGNVFENIFPMFEKVCSELRNDFYGTDSQNIDKSISIPLRNRKLQVVTKIVEYRVNEEANFDGVWHVEGMSHENVLATGLCIIQRDKNFKGAEIEFRRHLFEKEGNDLIYATPQNANRPTDTMGGGDVRPLGKMSTPFGRAIVFPNSHIHRLTNMFSSDGQDATRRILVFWLVNPNTPIVSSANVQPQQDKISWKDAQKYRLALMTERKLHKESYSEREVFLCEH